MTSITVFQLYAVGGLAMFVQRYMKLRSYTRRLQTMFDVLQDIRKDADDRRGTSVLNGTEIAFENVEVCTPAGVTLVNDLSFKVEKGTNLLITGPNGSGKSSIFRCLGSLWATKRGVITKPSGTEGKGLFGNVFYLPQVSIHPASPPCPASTPSVGSLLGSHVRNSHQGFHQPFARHRLVHLMLSDAYCDSQCASDSVCDTWSILSIEVVQRGCVDRVAVL